MTTNPVMQVLLARRSVRTYQDRPVEDEVKQEILRATLRAPTAGNWMLYSIIDVTRQAAKDTLAVTCDKQPFIARAPWVLLFLADYQRTYDYFTACGVPEWCERNGRTLAKPEESDLFLACCDALIAAQTAVVAAESLGLGSCYIGDILENDEAHRLLFDLPPYTFPICLLCLGYPTEQQKQRVQTTRFGQEYIVFDDHYQRHDPAALTRMYAAMEADWARGPRPAGIDNLGQAVYQRKFDAEFSHEARRSVKAMLERWMKGQE